jgi:hypothetical protein
MDGSPALQGAVSSIAKGITDQDNPDGPQLLSSVNPTFTWSAWHSAFRSPSASRTCRPACWSAPVNEAEFDPSGTNALANLIDNPTITFRAETMQRQVRLRR